MAIYMALRYMKENEINGEILTIKENGFEYEANNKEIVFVPFYN